jgi:hypothetical protein
MSDASHHQTTRGPSGPRVPALVAAVLVAVLALGFLAAGAVALWAHHAKEDEAGFISTASNPFATSTGALTTDDLDVGDGGPAWLLDAGLLGELRLTVEPHAGRPVFVGIARTADAARYLDGSAHAEVTDIDHAPFRAHLRTHPGGPAPAPPATAGLWAASAHGPGPQTLTWDVEEGSWSIVVMNEDGSPGVDVGVAAGAHVPGLATLGWVGAGIGLVLLVAAGLLLALGLRRSGDADGEPHAREPVTVHA